MSTTILKCLFLIIIPLALSYPKAGYSEECNKIVRCDTKASLTCRNGTCQCVIPEKMFFDTNTNQRKCVVIVGEKCIYTAVEMNEVTEMETKKYREFLPCVSKASCLDGFCVCDQGFFETSNGTCEKKRIFGEACHNTSNCRQDEHYICAEYGLCSCDKSSVYDQDKNKCVGLSGSLCKSFSGDCYKNTKCPPRPIKRYQLNWYPYQWVSEIKEFATETCHCGDGYMSTVQGFCFVSYGNPCQYGSFHQGCFPGLICKENKCSCKSENHQFYDTGIRGCRTLVGGPCLHEDEKEVCVENAECVNQLRRGTVRSQKCQCKVGFVEVDRKCEIAYGQMCGPAITVSCDTVAPLQCIEGTCQCKFLEYYDEVKKICRGLVDSACVKGNDTFCTEGASCEILRGTNGGIGMCTCKSNFIETFDRKCTQESSSIKSTSVESYETTVISTFTTINDN